jgi:hypothetical protein
MSAVFVSRSASDTASRRRVRCKVLVVGTAPVALAGFRCTSGLDVPGNSCVAHAVLAIGWYTTFETVNGTLSFRQSPADQCWRDRS